MIYCLIHQHVVIDKHQRGYATPNSMFWIPSDVAEIGWYYWDGSFFPDEASAVNAAALDVYEKAKSYRDAVLQAGYANNGKLYHADARSQAMITAVVSGIGLNIITQDIKWRAVDNTDTIFSTLEFPLFAAGMFAFVDAQYKTCFKLQDVLLSYSKIDDVLSFDIQQEWQKAAV